MRTVKAAPQRGRGQPDPAYSKGVTPAIIESIAATAADTVQLTFNTRVFKNRLPEYTGGAGGAATVTAATAISDTVIELVFSGEVQASSITVPEGGLGIRTAAGGFVPAGTYAVPTFP